MAASAITQDALRLQVKEEEEAFESTEEETPTDKDVVKWAKLLGKSEKYHILELEGTCEWAIPKYTLHTAQPVASPGPSKPKEVSSSVSIKIPQQPRLATFSGEEPTPKGEVSYLFVAV